jgi:hypothetical protein
LADIEKYAESLEHAQSCEKSLDAIILRCENAGREISKELEEFKNESLKSLALLKKTQQYLKGLSKKILFVAVLLLGFIGFNIEIASGTAHPITNIFGFHLVGFGTEEFLLSLFLVLLYLLVRGWWLIAKIIVLISVVSRHPPTRIFELTEKYSKAVQKLDGLVTNEIGKSEFDTKELKNILVHYRKSMELNLLVLEHFEFGVFSFFSFYLAFSAIKQFSEAMPSFPFSGWLTLAFFYFPVIAIALASPLTMWRVYSALKQLKKFASSYL